jgi:hypothetical protein
MSNINAGTRQLFSPQNYNFYETSMILPLHEADNSSLRDELALPESKNIITCIFAIYYAFSSEGNFREFLKNVSRNLKTGGFFICSYMNGKHVREIVKKVGNEVVGKIKNKTIWSIKMEKDRETPFGSQVKVSFSNLYNENHVEYLADLTDTRVVDIMREYGLVPHITERFTTDNKKITLEKDEKVWAQLHHNTCFKKIKIDTENTPIVTKSNPVKVNVVQTKVTARLKPQTEKPTVTTSKAKIKLKPRVKDKAKVKVKAIFQKQG